VRISPYDAAQRRHTSFASVFVYRWSTTRSTSTSRPATLRVDTFRASGAGGQHVNKTESAVRITHLPRTWSCSQPGRAQPAPQSRVRDADPARALCSSTSRSRSARRHSALTAAKKDIDFGSQIRSYVLQPYTMVNDHRTELKIGNVQAVLDGDLDAFIDAYLKQKENPVIPRHIFREYDIRGLHARS
jgi:peptide chain release factor 2